MFCKYCGDQLAVGQRNCKRCGTAVGAMSDCGGFYDLVQVEKPAAPVVQTKKNGSWIPVLLGIVGVLLALVIVLAVKQNQLTGEIEDLQNEIEDLSEEVVAEETTENTEASETITITLPELFTKEEPATESSTESEI